MKAYFCINEHGISTLGERYLEHLIVAVHSCSLQTRLQPILIYDGTDDMTIKNLGRLGCEVIYHELSFKEELNVLCKESGVNFNVASSAFLRLDIPLINDCDEYALYADIDVMFLKDLDLSRVKPELLAAAPEHQQDDYSYINSGVMVLNLPGLLREHRSFVNYLVNGKLKTSKGDPYDQGHINDYFKGRISPLSPYFNWKPYWGFNRDASIVHWHGVKYPAAVAISQNKHHEITAYDPHPEIFRRNPNGYSAYIKIFKDFVDDASLLISDDNVQDSLGCCEALTSIVGPSHAIRWSWLVRDKVLQSDISPSAYYGSGGVPIWSSNMLRLAEANLLDGGRVGVFVADFRFGNGIISEDIANSASVFSDTCTGINPSEISHESDSLMLARCMKALTIWSKALGDKGRFVFWDLFGREVLNRLSGKYISNGRYKHPTFNYDDIISAFGSPNIVDLSPLLKMQMHEVSRLLIDQSCHPSHIGYLFLDKSLCKGNDVIVSYKQAVSEIESYLFALAARLLNKLGRPVVISGNSIWVETLARYLGATGIARLAQAGMIISLLRPLYGSPMPLQLMKTTLNDKFYVLVFSIGGYCMRVALDDLLSAFPNYFDHLTYIDWESSTTEFIRLRGEQPAFQVAVDQAKVRENTVFHPLLESKMIEQGPRGNPTWLGLTHILNQILNGEIQLM